MSYFLTLGKAADFPDGKMRAFDIGGYEIAVEHDLESGEIRDIRCQMIIRVPWTGTVPNLQAVKEHLQAALVAEDLEQATEHLDKATKD